MSTIALMIDLETLSLRPNAYIAQVGFCMAVLETQRVVRTPVNFWLHDADQVDRESDPATVRWWMTQDQAVRESVFVPVQSLTMSAKALLDHFTELRAAAMRDGSKFTVWAKPAMFDLPVLTDLWGGKKPWSYKEERCLSTLSRTLDPVGKLQPEGNAMAHNAAADADWQMRYLLKLWPVVQAAQGKADDAVAVPA